MSEPDIDRNGEKVDLDEKLRRLGYDDLAEWAEEAKEAERDD